MSNVPLRVWFANLILVLFILVGILPLLFEAVRLCYPDGANPASNTGLGAVAVCHIPGLAYWANIGGLFWLALVFGGFLIAVPLIGGALFITLRSGYKKIVVLLGALVLLTISAYAVSSTFWPDTTDHRMPAATIYEPSSPTSLHPLISGSAQGVTEVVVSLGDKGELFWTSEPIPLVNYRWSATGTIPEIAFRIGTRDFIVVVSYKKPDAAGGAAPQGTKANWEK
jgi:hypothetical protein